MAFPCPPTGKSLYADESSVVVRHALNDVAGAASSNRRKPTLKTGHLPSPSRSCPLRDLRQVDLLARRPPNRSVSPVGYLERRGSR